MQEENCCAKYSYSGDLLKFASYSTEITIKSYIQIMHPDAKIPTKNIGDAGYDLYSVEDVTILPGHRAKVDTGIALRIPAGYIGLLWPRSGLAAKNGIDVMAGVIDSGYSDSIKVILYNTAYDSLSLSKGSKVAQYIIQQYFNTDFEIVDKLPESIRGFNGFGSSGM